MRGADECDKSSSIIGVHVSEILAQLQAKQFIPLCCRLSQQAPPGASGLEQPVYKAGLLFIGCYYNGLPS